MYCIYIVVTWYKRAVFNGEVNAIFFYQDKNIFLCLGTEMDFINTGCKYRPVKEL